MPDTYEPADLYTRRGAEYLSAKIAAYWSARGFVVRAEPREVSEGLWGVRTNLVNGMPPRAAGV